MTDNEIIRHQQFCPGKFVMLNLIRRYAVLYFVEILGFSIGKPLFTFW